MRILVFNVGSSSVKFALFDIGIEDHRIFNAEFENFKSDCCTLHYQLIDIKKPPQQRTECLCTIEDAITQIPQILKEFGYDHFDACGHRVTHGANYFQNAVMIDDAVKKHIEDCIPLAPLHNPFNLKAIDISKNLWPDIPQVAVFDTAFHETMPEHAYTYAVSKKWREEGVRRYGFHGISHKYVALRVASFLNRPLSDLQIISCHLGSGSSICAINHGVSIDTSMGMTPLEGLVMGTRCGNIDPGVFGYLERKFALSIQEIEKELYTNSGFKALSASHDLREIEQKAQEGDKDAQLAINMLSYRIRQYIGAYAASMGGVDVIAFTGGIGQNSASIRRRVCHDLGFLGLNLDDDKNEAIKLSGFEAIPIQRFDSRVKVIVTQTCEQLMMAQEVKHLLEKKKKPEKWYIPVAVSARHVHLCKDDLEALFGAGYELTKIKQLNQPDGWAAEETVEVIGPKGSFKTVRVLGPLREKTQIELSKTDTFIIGIKAPIRPSGQLESTPTVQLKGPKGKIETDGVIIAARHIHMSPDDAKKMELKNGDYVDVTLSDGERDISFGHTMIRIKKGYVTEMHIDTDEANAAGIEYCTKGELIINHTIKKADITWRTRIVE
jgi:acetate kinase